MGSHYQRLEKGSFRLLSFADNSGLLCGLQAYRLDEAPPYFALSYTWGQATNRKRRSSLSTYSITLNGEVFEVQENLYDALMHLGHHVRESQGLFWVDAICINQEDLDEKCSQVKKMKEIYESADEIFAWLGIPSDDAKTRLAVDLMREFHVYLKEGLRKHNDVNVLFATINTSHPGFPSTNGSQASIAWNGIAEIFSQPYWRRVWVYQEASTPKTIYFFYGHHLFDPILLSAAISFGSIFSRYRDFDIKCSESVGQSGGVWALLMARLAREGGKSRRLIDLVYELGNATCTDARDYIYAPLSHAIDVTLGQIVIDYKRDLVDIYMDFARFALFHPGLCGLEALGLVFIPASDASNKFLSWTPDIRMPSWVPDWRTRVKVRRLVNSAEIMVGNQSLYDPCPGTKIKARIRGRELEITGHITGDELRIGMLTTIWDDAKASLLTPRAWYDAVVATNQFRADLDETIRRSLVGDKSCAMPTTSDNASSPVWRRGGLVDRRFVDLGRDQLDHASLDTSLDSFSTMMRVCHGRRMGYLTDGRVAILPAAAKLTDQIAAFHGGHSLYLLRRLSSGDDAYTFVGECYVDGLMDGAFLGICSEANKSAKTVRLV